MFSLFQLFSHLTGRNFSACKVWGAIEAWPDNLLSLCRSWTIASWKCRHRSQRRCHVRSPCVFTFQFFAFKQHVKWNRRHVADDFFDAWSHSGHVQFRFIWVSMSLLHRIEAEGNLFALGNSRNVSPRDWILFLNHADDSTESFGQRYSAAHVCRFDPFTDDCQEIRNHFSIILRILNTR